MSGSHADTLEAELKKREQAELSELERVKKEKEELEENLSKLQPKAESYDALVAEWNEQVEAEKEGLTDEQVKIVEALGDPHLKLSLIRQYKAKEETRGPKVIKGGQTDKYDAEDVRKMLNDDDPEVRKQGKILQQRRKRELGASSRNAPSFG